MSNIPCIIVNRDRLSIPRRLVIDLLNLGYTNIHILDMASTYQPLLSWYHAQDNITVHYLRDNIGHKALWNSPIMKLFSDHEWLFYTDGDIQLNENTPVGFIEELIDIAKEFNEQKVGLAIEYIDIPSGPIADIITPIENRYWLNRKVHSKYPCYNAPIDTTGAIIKTSQPFQYQAIRVAGRFTCKHIPWYTTFDNLIEEERYYLEHSDPAISTYTAHYNNWKNTHE